MANYMSLNQARAILNSLYQAKQDIISGQAASYRIGSREVQLLSLEQVNDEIRRHEAIVDSKTGKRSDRQAKAVVFVDG